MDNQTYQSPNSNRNSEESALLYALRNQQATLDLTLKRQQKRDRLDLIFRSLRFFVTIVVLFLIFGSFRSATQGPAVPTAQPHIGIIDINDVIAGNTSASYEFFLDSIEQAYQNTQMKALIIRISSPGGSAVQSSLIYDSILDYRQRFPEIKVYSLVEELAASGAYYIASATESIIANRYSMVGSIGVIWSSFGVDRLLETWSIDRRTLKAGLHKDIMDPTKKESVFERHFIQANLDSAHQLFIHDIKQARGDRLNIKSSADEDMLFSGLFWVADQALELGLIDSLGSLASLRKKIAIDNIVIYTPELNWMTRLSQFSTRQVSILLQNHHYGLSLR